MKNLLLLPLALIFFQLAFYAKPLAAQDFSKVDAQARSTPFPQKQDTRALAQALTEGLNTEKEKARAIFVWIAENISYDVNTFEEMAELEPDLIQARSMPQEVLRRKKGVCEGYANLFTALCQASGVAALTASGKVKNPRGMVPKLGHAWNLVRTEGEWGLVDPTWGAGDLDIDERKYVRRFKPNFFLTPPKLFVLDHHPSDPLFQLLPNPVDFETFKKRKPQEPFADPDTMPDFAHRKDSLDFYLGLDSSNRTLNAGYRMIRFDPSDGEGYYLLGKHYFNSSASQYNQYVEENNRRIKDNAPPSLEWYEQSAKVLEKIKDQFLTAQRFIALISSGSPRRSVAAKVKSTITRHLTAIEHDIKSGKENAATLRKSNSGNVKVVFKKHN